MKKTNDFYKVVNAVINTLNNGESVAYVGENTGFDMFLQSMDSHEIRNFLLDDFNGIEEVDTDDVSSLFKKAELDITAFDFYQFDGRDGRFLQVAIAPSMYVDSYGLRDMIASDYDLPTAEITEGMNGYPSHLRGAVLIDDNEASFDSIERMAELYGVEVVNLRRRDGWNLWESRGWANKSYDMFHVYADDCNVEPFDSIESFSKRVEEMLADMDASEKEDKMKEFKSVEDEISSKTLPEGHLLLINWDFIRYYDIIRQTVNHYNYDVWNYQIALDCRVDN